MTDLEVHQPPATGRPTVIKGAVDAVLKLAAKWEHEAVSLDVLADSIDGTAPREHVRATMMSVRAQAYEGCARELRQAYAWHEECGGPICTRCDRCACEGGCSHPKAAMTDGQQLCQAHPDDCPNGPEPHAYHPPELDGLPCCRQPGFAMEES